MGTNDTIMIAGDLSPTPATATIKPSVTARLYAGAVEAMPMITLENKPTAFDLRPLSLSAVTTVGRTSRFVSPDNGTTGAVLAIVSSFVREDPRPPRRRQNGSTRGTGPVSYTHLRAHENR